MILTIELIFVEQL